MTAAHPLEYFQVGIIGTGVGIRTHAIGFRRLPGVSLAGVVGRGVDRAREALESAGLPGELGCSFDALIARRPDLICLTTPPGQRAMYLSALAQLDTALLMEKPLAANLEAAKRIYLPLADNPTRPLFVNHQLRGLAAFRWLRGKIAAGELGTIYRIALRERSPAFRRDRIKPWEADPRTGGGQRLAVGTHLLDLGVYLCGGSYDEVHHDPSYGAVSTPRGSWRAHVEPATGLVDEAFHGVVTCGGCWIDIFTTAIGHGPRSVEIDVEGTEGTARFRYQDGQGALELWGRSATHRLPLVEGGVLGPADRPTPVLGPSLFRLAFPGYAGNVVHAVRQGRAGPDLSSLIDGMGNIAILDALVARKDRPSQVERGHGEQP